MSTELAVQNTAPTAAQTAVQMLAEGKQTVFSTIKGDSVEARLAVFSAVTASLPIDENLNKPIKLANLVVQDVELTEKDDNGNEVYDLVTGEVKTSIQPRTILIDTDGVAYHAISKGLFRSIETLVGILGQNPDNWGGLTVVVNKEGAGNRKYFVLRPVIETAPKK